MTKKLMLVSLLALLSLTTAAAPARAQALDEPALRSPWAALGLSLGTTAATAAGSFLLVFYNGGSEGSEALLATGMIVGGLGLGFGPSAGHFYAGDTRRGLGMGLVRLGLMVGGIALELAALGMDGEYRYGQTICVVAGIAAGSTALALAIWDIAAAPGAARRANALARRRLTGLSVGPLVTDAALGERGYGLALGGRF